MDWHSALPAFGLRRLLLAALIALVLPPLARGATPPDSPVGLWQTVDDNIGRPRGLVRIFERDGIVFGRIEQIFQPDAASLTCRDCPGDRRGKTLLGLDIIRGLKPDGPGRWDGGEILDPETGSTYRASLQLEDGGRSLRVRGYLLLSALGRSQLWHRAD